MLYIGPHLSSAKGYLAMGQHALKLGANTLAFFTRNPRGGQAKAVDEADAASFLALASDNGFGPIVAHASYTMNPCSAKESVRAFTRETVLDDLNRLQNLRGCLYNMHPGGHGGQGTETGVEQIIEMLNAVLSPEQDTTLLLETMSGGGTMIGGCFEEIKAILDGVALSDHVGVCLDTCHVWGAGYDIVNDLDGVLTRFDRIIGLRRLKAVHLNDSKTPFGSQSDRHERIGLGTIGEDALARVVRHPALRGVPCILETPNEDDGWVREITVLQKRFADRA